MMVEAALCDIKIPCQTLGPDPGETFLSEDIEGFEDPVLSAPLFFLY
jgi:hypothetical protein